MALVTFRSRAAAEIIMVRDVADRLLEIIGKEAAERGVITPPQIEAALASLEQAVAAERARGEDRVDDEQPLHLQAVSLRQRAFPLMEMLRAARRRAVDVTWGI
jgi:Domain of unknown function (DUF1840)